MKTKTHSTLFTSLIVFLVLGLMVNQIFANDLLIGQNRGLSTDDIDLSIDNNMSTGSSVGANTTSSATTESADFSIASLEVTKASFAHASSTPAFVVPTNNNTSATPDIFVDVDGTSLIPVDAPSSLVAGSNLVVTDINDDGAADVLGDCDEIDCIAYVNDGTGRLIEDGVATVSEGIAVDTDIVLVAEPTDKQQITFRLKRIQLTDMDGDGHRDKIEPTNNGFLIRYYIGNNTFTAGDEYPYEDSDEEGPDE